MVGRQPCLSGAVGALAMSGFGGVKTGLFFVAASAVGPVILSRLALTSRPSQGPGSEGEVTAQGLQWYPEGRLVLWAAAMAGGLLTLVILALGPDAKSFQAMLSEAAAGISRVARGRNAGRTAGGTDAMGGLS